MARLFALTIPISALLAERGRRPVMLGVTALIALFGLAFKQGTDDLRESPLVVLAERLIGKGFELSIFDRSVQVARLTGCTAAVSLRRIIATIVPCFWAPRMAYPLLSK